MHQMRSRRKQRYEGKTVTVICNFEKTSQIDIPNNHGKILLANYSDRQDCSETFRPYEAVIFGDI